MNTLGLPRIDILTREQPDFPPVSKGESSSQVLTEHRRREITVRPSAAPLVGDEHTRLGTASVLTDRSTPERRRQREVALFWRNLGL